MDKPVIEIKRFYGAGPKGQNSRRNCMEKLKNKMILAEGAYYDLNDRVTQLNNNVCIAGASGSGKTRSIVEPNLLQAIGSYIITDPKGNLINRHAAYLKRKGYAVRKLNFSDPGDQTSCGYNFFHYIHSEQDCLKIAHMIIYASDTAEKRADPFWDAAAELFLVAVISYLYLHAAEKERTIQNMLSLIQGCEPDEYEETYQSATDVLFENIGRNNPDDFSYRCYSRFRQAACKTLKSIIITLNAHLAVFDTKECRRLLQKDTVRLEDIGEHKTALFVVVSDTDRSMDMMANLFLTQAIHELCRMADSHENSRLPIDVRFILDDFATNVRIADFPRMISSIRSRGISAMITIQSESQLSSAYGEDGRTILGTCDTCVYLGGNDIETAQHVARRVDQPITNILNMPVGTCWIFRRGQQPVNARIIQLDRFLEKLQIKPMENDNKA